MDGKQYAVAIYVLPTETGKPPRAVITAGVTLESEDGDTVMMVGVDQHLATWSRDMGTWTVDGAPIPDADLCDAITEHAKELGVEW